MPSSSCSEYPACYVCVCFPFFARRPVLVPFPFRSLSPLFVWVRRLPPFRFLLMAQITTHNFRITSAHLDVCECGECASLGVLYPVCTFFLQLGNATFCCLLTLVNVAIWKSIFLMAVRRYSPPQDPQDPPKGAGTHRHSTCTNTAAPLIFNRPQRFSN